MKQESSINYTLTQAEINAI